MPSVVRDRIAKLMDEQKAEAPLPTSRAVMDFGEQEIDTPEVEDRETPEMPLPEIAQQVQPEAQDIEQPEPSEVAREEPPVPEKADFPEPENGTFQEHQTETDNSLEALNVPEQSQDAEFQPPEQDWEKLLNLVGQQGNDQLFDNLAIATAETMHRQVNRFQDRMDQRLAELDIGNSF